MQVANFVIAIYIIGQNVFADFEVCNPETSDTVYQFVYDNCPFGVLFDHPITANCLASTNYPEHFITNLCNPSRKPLSEHDNPYQIHLAFRMDPEPVNSESSCFGAGPDKCEAEYVTQATNDTFTPPFQPGCDLGYENQVINLAPEEEARRKDARVFNQTEKLFRHMLNLVDDDEDADGLHFRLIKLLKSCFRIYKKMSTTKFITGEFGKDVLKAFLYLFTDSDLTNFKDISVEDYKIISRTLTACENMAPPFTLIGRSCRTCATVYNIEKLGNILRYQENEFSFVWGKYDVPTDATWSVITFVHGLCYGTYRLHVNYHHVYEREMERLFTPEILYRWSRPPLLHHEDLWDHLFSTSVKDAMKNLDVCIFGAYHDTPFLHRLERPIKMAASKRRQTRSLLPTLSLDDGGLQGAGWCFQTEAEMVATVASYLSYHCPSVQMPQEITQPNNSEAVIRVSSHSKVAENIEDESDSFERF